MTHHHEADTPNSTPLPSAGPDDAPSRVDLGYIGKRTAQVGGLALAAYVMTAVAAGYGVASADTGETSRAGSVSPSAQSDTSGTDDEESDSGALQSSDTGDDESAGSQPSLHRSGSAESDDELEHVSDVDIDIADADASGEADLENISEAEDDIIVGEDTIDDRGDHRRSVPAAEDASGDADSAEQSAEVLADIVVVAPDQEAAKPGSAVQPVGAEEAPAAAPFDLSGQATALRASDEPGRPSSVSLATVTTLDTVVPAGETVDEPVQTLFAWSLLGWVRRNFFNQAPVLDYDPSTNVQGPLGVITGHLGATDPEGDALTYTVIARPKHGTVVIDDVTGTFVYTPDLEYAMAGGADTFRVRVTDGKLNLLHFLRPDFGMPRVTVSLGVQSIQPSADRFIVPLPAEVTQPQNPAYTADGAALIFRATPVGATRTEIYRVATDGSGLQCLTCGLAPELTDNLSKPFVFDDGNRILLSAGTQSDTGGETADHYILECVGGVSTCGVGSQLLEITVPTDVPVNVVVLQKQRELRVAPDGVHVGFTQLLASGTATQLVSSIGRLERTETGYDVVDARVVYVGGELKNFTSDGKGVMITDFSGKYEAGNADNVLVNLSDGAVTRLTANLDYDESVDMSPNGQWLALGSSRTLDYLTPMSQIKRPTFVPAYVVFPTFQAKKGSLNQAWVVSIDDELSGENGIFLGDPSGAYNSVPVANWSPDGSTVAFWERSNTDPSDTRLVIARLNNIDGGTRPSDDSTPDPSAWAQPLSSVVVKASPTEASRAGKTGGSAEVMTSKTGNLTTTTVTYVDFEDEPGLILNGTETTITNPTLTNITYSADISVTGGGGSDRGYLRADGVKIVNQLSLTGLIESSLDGNVLVMGSPAM